MSRDVTLGTNDPWDESDDFVADFPNESVLDRPVALPLALGRGMAAVAALVVAVLLRFPGLDRWPLTVSGADIALAAHNLARGESTPPHLVGAPFAVDWTALFLFAAGSSDSIARMAMAVAGVLAVLCILALSSLLNGRVAVAAAVLAAMSPTLVAASRRVDGGALLVLMTVAVLHAASMSQSRGGLGWPIAAGAATAALALSGPFGPLSAILAWLAVIVLLRPDRAPSRDATLAAVAGGLGATVLATTALLTRPANFSASIGEAVQLSWSVHLSQFGSLFWMPAFDLILNEPLLIALAIVALIASPRRETVRSLSGWFIAALGIASLFGDTANAGYAIVTLPLALLAGVGVAHLIERVPWCSFRRGPAFLYTLAVLLMAAAIISLLGLVTGGASNDTAGWLVRFALVVLVGLLPLSLALSAIGSRVAGSRLVLVLVAGLAVLGLVTIRSSVLSASERPGEAGDPLASGQTDLAISVIVGRIERLSRDTTMNQRTSQDPTGGHGLRIAIDESVSQPFRWYFRDYPNVSLFDASTEPVPGEAEIVLLGGEHDAKSVTPAFVGQQYRYASLNPEIYESPNWDGLFGALFTPDGWRRFADFLLNRDPLVPAPTREFQFLASGELAQRLFAATGPFSLDDRVGAGSAEGQFNRPRGIAVAPDGSTYIVDARNARVQKFGPDGEFLLAFGSEGSGTGQFGRFATAGGGGANGIAVSADGDVYVADTWNHRIQVFSPDGAYLRAWGQFFDAGDDPAAAATGAGSFYGPRGIAAHDGRIFVTDTGNERVQVFDENGAFVDMFGVTGSGDGQLLEPVGVAVAADGTVLVADSHNSRIARFTPEGEWIEPWAVEQWTGQQFFEPYLTVGPDGMVYASTSTAGTVQAFGPAGVPGQTLGASLLRQPFGLAVTTDGRALLVTDGALNAVVTVPVPPR